MDDTTLNVRYTNSWIVAFLWLFIKSKSTLCTTSGQYKMVTMFGKHLVDKRIND